MIEVTRIAEANWKGDLKSGHGLTTTESKALTETAYSFGTRFGDEDRPETNPEELIAAAAASCWSMALSKTLTGDVAVPTEIITKATVTLRIEESGPKWAELVLETSAIADGLNDEKLAAAVEKTKAGCPVYNLLAAGFASARVTSSVPG